MGDDTAVERVEPRHACPRCREDDMDLLLWVEDDAVECQSCGMRYDPASDDSGVEQD